MDLTTLLGTAVFTRDL